MRLTKNIYREEIACKCLCGDNHIDYSVILSVQNICDIAAEIKGIEKVLANIVSGVRCCWHNGKVDGKRNSRHLTGQAIDFNINECSTGELEEIIQDNLDLNIFDYYINGNVAHIEYDPKKKQ